MLSKLDILVNLLRKGIKPDPSLIGRYGLPQYTDRSSGNVLGRSTEQPTYQQQLSKQPVNTAILNAVTGYGADIIENPVQTLAIDPAVAAVKSPAKTLQAFGDLTSARLQGATGRPNQQKLESGLTSLAEAAGGAAEVVGVGLPIAKAGAKPLRASLDNLLSKDPNRLQPKPVTSISDDIAEQVGTADEVTPVVDERFDPEIQATKVVDEVNEVKQDAIPLPNAPKKTQKAYKLFKRKKGQEGLYPLFVNADKGVEQNQWIKAEVGEITDKGKVKSKLGPLAYRPGWHAGDYASATHIGGKSTKGLTKPDYRPADQVWAEVEVADDFNWQDVANSRASIVQSGANKGKINVKEAHITDQIPEGGHYRYKTNPNMQGNWIISGEMKVNKPLTKDEVFKVGQDTGIEDLPILPDVIEQKGLKIEDLNAQAVKELKDYYPEKYKEMTGQPSAPQELMPTSVVDNAVDAADELMPPSRIAEQSLEKIKNNAKVKNVKLDVFENNDTINVSRIVVPEKQKGTGTSIMNEIIDYADNNSKTITLTPSTDFGATSVTRLKNFYKRFGFVENKGANKNFKFRDTMYRDPSKPQELMPTSAVDDAVDAADELMPPSRIADEATATPLANETKESMQKTYAYLQKQSGMKPKEFKEFLENARTDPKSAEMLFNINNRFTVTARGLGAKPASEEIITKGIIEQSADQARRINKSFDAALGNPDTAFQTLKGIKAKIKSEASPLYDKAYSQEFVMTQGLQDVMSIPLLVKYEKSAVKRLNELKKPTGKLRVLHQVKRKLDGDIGKAIKSGASDEVSDLLQLKNKLLDEIDIASPNYKKARKIYANQKANENALSYGEKNIFSGTVNAEEFAEDIAKYSKSELESLRVGIKKAISKVEAGKPVTYNAVDKKFIIPNTRAKLEIAIGKDSADKLYQSVDAEAAMFRQSSSVAPLNNSRSLLNAEAIQQAELGLKNPVKIGVAKAGQAVVEANANPATLLGRGVSSIVKKGTDSVSASYNEQLAKAAADILTRPANEGIDILLAAAPQEKVGIAREIISQTQGKPVTPLKRKAIEVLSAQALNPEMQNIARGLGGAGAVSATSSDEPNVLSNILAAPIDTIDSNLPIVTTKQQHNKLQSGQKFRTYIDGKLTIMTKK